MEHIAALSELQKTLEPLEVVVWGEAAMVNLGVPIVPYVSFLFNYFANRRTTPSVLMKPDFPLFLIQRR